MLIKIARFEFRYLLRNPLLWITAAVGFAIIFFSMNLEGWELGSEGGLYRNSAYATLRNSVMFTPLCQRAPPAKFVFTCSQCF